jgi:hypothetical protein
VDIGRVQVADTKEVDVDVDVNGPAAIDALHRLITARVLQDGVEDGDLLAEYRDLVLAVEEEVAVGGADRQVVIVVLQPVVCPLTDIDIGRPGRDL